MVNLSNALLSEVEGHEWLNFQNLRFPFTLRQALGERKNLNSTALRNDAAPILDTAIENKPKNQIFSDIQPQTECEKIYRQCGAVK